MEDCWKPKNDLKERKKTKGKEWAFMWKNRGLKKKKNGAKFNCKKSKDQNLFRKFL